MYIPYVHTSQNLCRVYAWKSPYLFPLTLKVSCVLCVWYYSTLGFSSWLLLIIIYVEPADVRLIDVIGRGTYGVVYKSVWHGCIVASKVISTPAIAREQAMKEIEAFR